jgi:hypothetical protein
MVGSETKPGDLLDAAREALELAIVDELLLPAERAYLGATAKRLSAMTNELRGRVDVPSKPEPEPLARPVKVYSRKEAAALISVHPNSLINWEEKGLLTPQRDWRGWRVYSREDLARAMALAAHLPLADLPGKS